MHRGLAFLAALFLAAHAHASDVLLSQVAEISLPGVDGRIDHISYDLKGNRLFVSALGNDSVEVVDLSSNSVTHSIRGLSEPQGVVFVPNVNKIYVTNAGNGECDVYDGSSFSLLKRIYLGGDADNVHLDSDGKRLYISAGDALVALDTEKDVVVGSVSLSGHPEGFALEQNGNRVFVNVPLPSREVFVVDRSANKVTAHWSVGGLLSATFSNFPLSLDEADGRLFVGVRVPSSLKVIDVSSGKVIADAGIDGDPDDVFFDSTRHRVYVSCGAGFIDIFQQSDADHYQKMARVPTAAGGRTSLWVPEWDRLFVAVPRAGNTPAQIRVYSAQ